MGSPEILIGLGVLFLLTPAAWGDHKHLILKACADVGIASPEKLAVALDIDRAQLHRQLNGEGHFSLTRLCDEMPPAFWRAYGFQLLLHFGLPKEAQRLWRLAFAVIGNKRMARVDISERKKRTA